MLCPATLHVHNRCHEWTKRGGILRLPFADTSTVLPSPTVWCSACRGSLTLYPLEHHNVSFPGITFPEIADVLPSILLVHGFFNPPRMANEHTH